MGEVVELPEGRQRLLLCPRKAPLHLSDYERILRDYTRRLESLVRDCLAFIERKRVGPCPVEPALVAVKSFIDVTPKFAQAWVCAGYEHSGVPLLVQVNAQAARLYVALEQMRLPEAFSESGAAEAHRLIESIGTTLEGFLKTTLTAAG